jgi:hypothetical protein
VGEESDRVQLLVRSAALAVALAVALLVGVAPRWSPASGVEAGALGADQADQADQAEPFTGTFEGAAYGTGGTSAPLALALAQRGTEVSGSATLGEGLYVTTARCGGAAVPAGTVEGRGQTQPDNPRHVSVQTAVRVQGIDVPVSLVGDLSPDGQTLTAAASLDVPAFCGPDPTVPGTLQRTDGVAAPVA